MDSLNVRNIDIQNLNNIREQILLKKGSDPYFATASDGSIALTDYDNFPYNRWYRGSPYSTKPIIAEREAGWRPIQTQCYDGKEDTEVLTKPRMCFEVPCSTVFPCFPEFLNKYADNELLGLLVEKSSVLQYR